MRKVTMPQAVEAENQRIASESHDRRVGMVAAELCKRLKWPRGKEEELLTQVAAHDAEQGGGRLIPRLMTEVWGCAPADEAGKAKRVHGGLLELCCLFVQRWEFAPYELTAYAEIVQELRTIALDGFLAPADVEALAVAPLVSLAQIREVVGKLPVFPAVALKAMKVAQNPLANAGQIEEIIGSDAVLAGEILRTANSPLFAPAVQIHSIRQAIVFMGIGECARVLAASAFRPMFQSPLVRPLWNHSMEVARLASALSHMSGRTDPEEAFLAGLMHDVGRLALWKLPARIAQQYTAMIGSGCEAIFAETLLCGFDHTVAGREVMAHWKLPEDMAEAIEHHHQPERSDFELSHVLYLAEHASGAGEDLPSLARFQIALERTGLSAEQVNGLPDSAGWVQ